jgi:hypothetical protein
MGKLDKKVLKVISTQGDIDYDVDDISIALKCDDEEVQDALDSLKDQGLIEAVIHNGKKYWKQARPDPFSDDDQPVISPRPQRDESSIDLLILDQPVHPLKQREQPNTFSRAQEQVSQPTVSTGQPAHQSYNNEFIDDMTRPYAPPKQPAKFKETPMNDDEFEKPKSVVSSIGSIALAVLLAAGVSALITMTLTNNAVKGSNGAIAALEGKMNEASNKLNQRIDALSLKMDNLKTDLTAQQNIPTPVQEPQVKEPVREKSVLKHSKKSSVKSVASRKPASKSAIASKKRKTPAEMIQETSESSISAGESPSLSTTPTEPASASSSESSGAISGSSSVTESSPAATSESGTSSETPVTAPSPIQSGGEGEGSSPASTDGNGQ